MPRAAGIVAGLGLIALLLGGCVAAGYVLSVAGVAAGAVDRTLLKAEVEALRQRVDALQPVAPTQTAWEQFRRQEWALEARQRAGEPPRGDGSSVPLASPMTEGVNLGGNGVVAFRVYGLPLAQGRAKAARLPGGQR